MQINITINISRIHFLVLTGLLLALVISVISFSALALTRSEVLQRSPAYHLLKDIYTIVHGNYVPVVTPEGYINAALIKGKVAEAVNADKLDGKDWSDMGECSSGYVFRGFDSSGNKVCTRNLEVNGVVKGLAFCLGDDCITRWPTSSGTLTERQTLYRSGDPLKNKICISQTGSCVELYPQIKYYDNDCNEIYITSDINDPDEVKQKILESILCFMKSPDETKRCNIMNLINAYMCMQNMESSDFRVEPSLFYCYQSTAVPCE